MAASDTKTRMKPLNILFALLSALALSIATVGCDRTVSTSEKTSVSNDGTVKSKETTVTEKSDGTMVKKEETKKTTPAK